MIRAAILCVSVVLIVYGGINLIRYIHDYNAARETTQELRKIYTQAGGETDNNNIISINDDNDPPASTFPTKPKSDNDFAATMTTNKTELSPYLSPLDYPNGLKVSPKIRELRKKSNDIIGWISMDDLDEPVVMRDNLFFLTHDALGKRNSNGAIFMDEDTNLLTRPYTILLYGHNMKTGAMFGNLRKYEKLSYCSKHQIIGFESLYEDGQFVIFAVSNISIKPGSRRYVSLDGIQSLNRLIRRQALESLMKLSLNGVTLDVNEEDQLLLLITCVGEDDDRLIVAARRMRDNEKADSLILKNSHSDD